MRAEALKGHLHGLLLATLDSGPRHGYAIIEALREATNGHVELPTGTIYPALRRLERDGLIRGTWSSPTGRRRRIYELTPAGRRALGTERTGWHEFVATITAALEGRPCPTIP
jgi:PadR family transcriptional regulator PadR